MPGFLTDEEMKLAAQVRESGFGDDDDETLEGKPAAVDPPADPPADPAPAAAAADDTPPADPPADEPAADERPEVPSAFAPVLRADDPAGYDEKLKAVAKERMDATKAWRAGEMDDDAYDAKLAELEAQKDELIEARTTAKVSVKINAETQAQAFDRDKDSFISTMSKYEGVPYKSTPMLMAAFNTELAAAGKAALKDNPNATAQELFETAHKAVLEQFAALGVTFGKKGAAPAPSPAPAAAAAAAGQKPGAKPAIPPNLGRVPAAAAAPTGGEMGEVVQKLSTLEGEDLEIAMAKLSPDQKRRLLAEM